MPDAFAPAHLLATYGNQRDREAGFRYIQSYSAIKKTERRALATVS